MTLFNTIDKDLEYILKNIGAEKPKAELMNALMELAPPYDYYEGMDEPVVKTEPDVVEHLGVEIGEKRKPYVFPCFLCTRLINLFMIAPISSWQISGHTNGHVLAYRRGHHLDFANLPLFLYPFHSLMPRLPMVKKILRSLQSSGGVLYKATLSSLMAFLGYLLHRRDSPRE